ncbi:MAG TPA: histidinol-phosphate transaminase [Abditibacteriaceae bacterium]|jgi:histidinol-phosphate aminotransferase
MSVQTTDLLRAGVEKLRPYVPGKPIDEVKRELGLPDDLEIIKLASNENVLGPSPRALAAIAEAAPESWLYPDDTCFELKNALAKFWDVAPEQLVIGNGSDEILHFLGLAFLDRDDEVVFGEPSFVQYKAAAMLANVTYVPVPLDAEMRHDLRAMKAAITERTKMVFIANPNNPTGTTVSRADFEEFLEDLPPRVVVVLDQAYYEYVMTDDSPNALDYIRAGHNVVALHTFSKAYALAGLRVGYGIASPELAGYLQQVRGPFNVNLPAQAAAIASLHDDEQVAKAYACNSAGLEQFYAAFDELGLKYVPSEANFVLFNVGRNAKTVADSLMRRGVIVRVGFGLPDMIRVTVGTRAMNERFISSLREVLSA